MRVGGLYLLFLVLFIGTALAASVDTEVEGTVSSEGSARVIVELRDDSSFQIPDISSVSAEERKHSAAKQLSAKKKMVGSVQERVISALDVAGRDENFSIEKNDFDVKRKYEVTNGFSGIVTAQGLEKLRDNPDVESVQIDRVVNVFLDVSVPLINATKVWPLIYNSTNLTGKGQTVCVIDTGVDYTHPSLGGCSITKYDTAGANESHILESIHPYANNYDNTSTVTMPGYSRIAVHFRNISLEYQGEVGGADAYDRIIIYDSNMREIANYHGINGVIEDLWTPYADGDTIHIRLKTDAGFTDYGYYIDQVRNGTTDTTYNWSGCSKVIGGWDFVNNDGDPMDDHNHGTHVAGIIASANETYRGVAPDAKIAAAKVLDSAGLGWESDVIAGIDWCVNRSVDFNISVISMSLGGGGPYNSYCNSTSYDTSINSAVGQGIFVAVASGNKGWSDGIASPACVENATSVGAVYDADVGSQSWSDASCTDSTTFADKIACFSNSGTILDLLAPGSVTTSSLRGGGVTTMSGTSMATPHVAGAAALLFQYNSSMTPYDVRRTLNSTGKPINDTRNSIVFSRIDLLAAIASLDNEEPVISFVSPTPANNTAVSGASILINISSNEVINIALLEWNGTTNETMNVSGLYAIKRKVGLNGTYSYKVYANDTFGNFGVTGTYNLNISNSAPNITGFTPDAAIVNISEIQDRTCNISYSDPDGDTVSVAWYRNGTQVSTADNYTFIGSPSASGTYNISVNITDGDMSDFHSWLLVVNDTMMPPQITGFTPDAAIVNISEPQDLTFNISYSDPDGDNVSVAWYNNGTLVSTADNYTFIGNYSAAGTYNISVNITDSYLSDFHSWILFVNNTNRIPNATVLYPDEYTAVRSTVVVNASVTDHDGNGTISIVSFSYSNDTINWFLIGNDTDNSDTIYNITWDTTNVNSGPNYTIKVNASDSFNFSSDMSDSEFLIDNNLSAINLTSPLNSSWTNDNTTEVSMIFNGTGSSVDNSSILVVISQDVSYAYPNMSCSQAGERLQCGFNTSGLSDGTHNLTVNVTDIAGNPVVSQETSFMVDTSAPDITIIAPSAGLRTTDTTPAVNMTLNDTTGADVFAGVNISSLVVNISGAANHTLTQANLTCTAFTGGFECNMMQAPALSDGSHSMLVSISDNVSNTATLNRTFTIDLTPPTVTSSSPSDTKPSGTTIVVLSVTLDENGSVCRYSATDVNLSSMDGAMSLDSGTTYTASVSVGAGSYLYHVRCNDTLGNTMNSSATISFSVASVSSSSGGGGGGAVSVQKGKASHTFISMKAGERNRMKVSVKSLAVTSNIFVLNRNFQKAKITIQKVNESQAPSNISDAYQYFRVDAGLIDSDVSFAEIEFRVNKTWLSGFGIDSVYLQRYVNNRWARLQTSRINSTADYYHYMAKTPGFSYFAITAENPVPAVQAAAVAEPAGKETAETPPSVISAEDIHVVEEREPGVQGNVVLEIDPERRGSKIVAYLMIALVIMVSLAALFDHLYEEKKTCL